ncbi:MAG: hypothetical protein JNL01_02080 [Bdellovibrionales bacterium]|nr:hypothetical protein [Bdellovibrionales bacterium]
MIPSVKKEFIRLRFHFLATILTLVLTLNLFNRFVAWVETRPGSVLQDPILAMLTPRDFTVPVFIIIYGAIPLILFVLRNNPLQLLKLFQSYIAMIWIRTLAMYALPLDPPTGMILLRDPVVEMVGDAGRMLTRDLFFSGHTATVFLFAAFMPTWKGKAALGFATAALMFMLAAQHVHYTVDLVAAPFFTYGAVMIVNRLHALRTRGVLK